MDSQKSADANEEIIEELLREKLGDLAVGGGEVEAEEKVATKAGVEKKDRVEIVEDRGDVKDDEDREWDECSTKSEDEKDVEGEDLELVVDEEALQEEEKELTEEENQARYSTSCFTKQSANTLFRSLSAASSTDYQEPLHLYSQALRQCPLRYKGDRAILYSNRAACRAKMGKNEKAIEDCTKALELDPDYIKALVRRAKLYEETDKLDEALDDYKAVLQIDGSIHEARAASMRLPQQINDRNERLKTEMMGKLKDLGNMVLRPFGLSTENFQVNQDPSTGSYSINFQQRPPPPPTNGK